MSRFSNRSYALIITSLASFLTPFMLSSVNIALPKIGDEFSLNAILLSWVTISYTLASAMFLVPFGRIADIYGRRKVFSYGMVVYTLASALCASSVSSSMLIISRVIQGIGGAMIFGTSVAILTSTYPSNERGRVLGINVAVVYIGLSLGPTLGGIMTQQLGWRSIFIANVLLGIIVSIFAFWKLKEEHIQPEGEKFDFFGSLIYGIMLISIMYGFSKLPEIEGIILIYTGILFVLAFIGWELKSKYPVLNLTLFRNSKVFAFSNLAALINYSATAAVGFLLSLYLQYIKGLSAQNAGFVLLSQPIIQAVFSPFAGKLSDRIEPRIVASIGMSLSMLCLFLLSLIANETLLIFIVVILVFLGFGFALFSSPNTNAIMSSTEKKFYGVASGTLATMRLIGQILSMGIVMIIFALYMGRVKITPEHYQAFLMSAKTAFVIFAILCFFGVLSSLARGKVR
ncbi:MAG: MFS transporter [bacterium]